MKFNFMLLIISMILISCSSNTWIKKLPIHQKFEKEINYLGNDRSGKIVLRDGKIINAIKMQVVRDTLKYLDTQQAHYGTVHLGNTKELKFKDHTVGIFYGLVGGAGIGTAMGYVSVDRNVEMAGLAILGYMVGGGVLGAITGGILGINRNYIFVEKEE